MKLNYHIFASKLAQRIFVLFFLCALIPVCGLAAIAYQHVNRQLDEQFHARLKRSVKSYSLFLYERFLILETEMMLTATLLGSSNAAFSESMESHFLKRLQDRFTAMNLINQRNGSRILFGRSVPIDSFSKKELDHLATGNSVVKNLTRSGGNHDLVMILQMNPDKPGTGFLVAVINPDYILALNQEYHLPRNTNLLVRDESHVILFSSLGPDVSLPPTFFQNAVGRNSGNFEFEWADNTYLACFRWLFMKPKFLIPGINITFIQSETDAFFHLVQFNKIFPQILILSLLVVLLFSFYFIRRSLEPLKILKDGTHQIAAKNFNHRVEIASRDEFEELGQAFNLMSVQLHDQFYTIETNAQITRSVLSSLDTKRILNTVISRMMDCFSCEAAAIGLMQGQRVGEINCYFPGKQVEKSPQMVRSKLSPTDLKKLDGKAEFLILKHDRHLPDYLTIFKQDGINIYLVLPIFLESDLAAILMMAYRHAGALNEDCSRGRQMADQVAVALKNSRLMERLDRLNWGALKALARAVDAKSSWTAGHSERVTQLTLNLADLLINDPKERENLHRAALLHDIGKLGIQAAIIDKPGALSDEEYKKIKSHPEIGARILEPIDEYKPLIPIVIQHHERFDGRGYPNGLAGNEIHLGARILAVADVFDSMISDRPYREGMPFEKVMEIMREERGRQFDPQIVDALINIIYRKRLKAA